MLSIWIKTRESVTCPWSPHWSGPCLPPSPATLVPTPAELLSLISSNSAQHRLPQGLCMCQHPLPGTLPSQLVIVQILAH